MLEIAIMIEGQNGLNWESWQRMARAVEELGFVGLYRSDHYTNANPPDQDSLELWVSLAWLASHTTRIAFGPLVTPFSFRHPTMTARMASAVDDLSGGRLTLGLGAGWQEREHANFGWELLEPKRRFRRFEEGLQIVTRLLRSDVPVTFAGDFYRLNDAVLLPRPKRQIPILVGGSGEKRTLPLVARYADEWNANFQTPANYARLNTLLDELLSTSSTEPRVLRRSLMTGCVFGKDDAALQSKITARGRSVEQLRERGIVVGNTSQVVEQLGEIAEAGAQRMMLQWLDLDDMDGLEKLAKDVMSQFK
jgi:F420-dependent oxidoreductase-like protein